MDRKKYRIGPDWFGFSFALVASFVALYFVKNNIRSNLFRYTFSWLHVALFVIITFTTLRGFTPSKNGVTVDILGIPIQKIPWSEIRQVCVVRRKRLGSPEHLMILTLWGCDLFRPGEDDLDNYLSKHPFKAICINLRLRTSDRHIRDFREFTDKVVERDL